MVGELRRVIRSFSFSILINSSVANRDKLSFAVSSVGRLLYRLLDIFCIVCWTFAVSFVGHFLYRMLDVYCIVCWAFVISSVGPFKTPL